MLYAEGKVEIGEWFDHGSCPRQDHRHLHLPSHFRKQAPTVGSMDDEHTDLLDCPQQQNYARIMGLIWVQNEVPLHVLKVVNDGMIEEIHEIWTGYYEYVRV